MTEKNHLGEIVAKRIEHLRARPKVAIYKPKISSRHVRNLYTESEVRGHIVKSDYPEPAGGENLAPNPIELLLSAMASCIEAAFYEFAEYEGLTIHSITVDIKGELDLRGLFMVDETVDAGFRELAYTFRIETPDPAEKVKNLAEKVVDHCPVVDSLRRPINIHGEIEIRKPE
ncbi:MAG: OsmC family protein [Deltaproteobacteria bacterium]|nr:OsmC family protein [Deltaproteobacteria bacterium]